MSAYVRENISEEIRSSRRFRFGKNWQSFLRTVDERSIEEAERRLIEFLGVSSLDGKTFLDVGSGSGLHSLAACRLGARVVSFDYDPASVEATRRLRSRSGFADDRWKVEAGSVLDVGYLATLGRFDVVYSWGVLHHTGAMWDTLENVQPLVKQGGKLYIAIYNDLGEVSRWWAERKTRYVELPRTVRPLYFLKIYLPIELKAMGVWGFLRSGKFSKVRREFPKWRKQWREYKQHRGMSRVHDMIDWIGGYPYEYAKAEDLVASTRRRASGSPKWRAPTVRAITSWSSLEARFPEPAGLGAEHAGRDGDALPSGDWKYSVSLCKSVATLEKLASLIGEVYGASVAEMPTMAEGRLASGWARRLTLPCGCHPPQQPSPLTAGGDADWTCCLRSPLLLAKPFSTTACSSPCTTRGAQVVYEDANGRTIAPPGSRQERAFAAGPLAQSYTQPTELAHDTNPERNRVRCIYPYLSR